MNLREGLSIAALNCGLGLGLTLTVGPATSFAQTPAAAQLLPAQSDISFTSRQMGVPVDGRFTKFDAQVQFDPKRPEAARVSFTIDLTSVDIGAPETRAELRKPGWFDSARMPSASFASSGGATGVRALGGNRFEIAGTLTIKGNARPVVVPVALTQAAGITRAEGSFTLKRLDFKIGDGDWNDVSLVANDVVVRLRLTFTGIPAL